LPVSIDVPDVLDRVLRLVVVLHDLDGHVASRELEELRDVGAAQHVAAVDEQRQARPPHHVRDEEAREREVVAALRRRIVLALQRVEADRLRCVVHHGLREDVPADRLAGVEAGEDIHAQKVRM
jgi:hypothetical protein